MKPYGRYAQRIMLMGAGILGALVIAELGLRGAGAVYRLARQWRAPPGRSVAQRVARDRILCIGDSFTFGVGAPEGYGYPEQLERLRRQKDPPASLEVRNRGVPSANSSQILHRLERELVAFQPTVVLILAGTNNTWNTTQASVPHPWRPRWSPWVAWAGQLRITKAFRLMRMWSRRQLARYREGWSQPMSLLHLELGPQGAEAALTRLAGQPPSDHRDLTMGLIALGQRRFAVASTAFHHSLLAHPGRAEPYLGLAAVALLQADPASAQPFLQSALRIDAKNATAYALLASAYLMQNDREKARDALKRAARLDPSLEYPGVDGDHSLEFSPHSSGRLEAWLTGDLGEMVQVVRQCGARPILITYPSAFSGDQPVSAIIRAVSARDHVALADLETVFHALPEQVRGMMFASDHLHLNGTGYAMMAAYLDRILDDQESTTSVDVGSSYGAAAGSRSGSERSGR